MSKKSRISARVDEDVKEEAERILDRMGLSTSAAVSMFMSQIVQEQGIPFRPGLAPNTDTRQAMDRARSGDVQVAESEDEFFDDLGMS